MDAECLSEIIFAHYKNEKIKFIMAQIITKIGREKYITSSTNGRHEIIADEPTPYGKDKGPTPYDLLLMALGKDGTWKKFMYT